MNISKIIALSFSFLIVFLFASCNVFQSSNVPIESEEYAVYSTVLKEFARDNSKTLLINEKTSFVMRVFFDSDDESSNEEELITSLAGVYSQLEESTIRDYVSKNLNHSTLENKIKLPVKYVLFDKPKLKSEGEISSELHEKYSQSMIGYINLTRVGFNKDKTEAFVSIEHICLALCGGGDSFVLEKKNKFWKVKEVINGWKS